MSDIEIARLVDSLMRRIHASLNAKAATFDIHQVGPGGGILLLTLAEIEPIPIQELARQMSRDKSQITRATKALERKGLLERRESPKDARVCLLALTPMGQETVDMLQQAVADVLANILSPLSSAEQQSLKSLLSRI
ncbi:MAG: MarR family transcriptional regulator [Pseudomonadota bacterium]